MCTGELLLNLRKTKLRIRSFGKIFGRTAAMLFLATSLSLPINVRAQQRAKRKLPAVQKATVVLTEKGYEPSSLKLRRGVPAQITFVRKVSATCATQILMADYNIKSTLPLNEPVLVEFTPKKLGTFAFTCGMGMLRGSLIVR